MMPGMMPSASMMGGPMMGGPAGPTGPAAVPPVSNGMRERGFVDVDIAMKTLTQALTKIGPETPEGQAIVSALKALGAKFGQASGDLTRQEVKVLGEAVPPTSQMPQPAEMKAFQDALRSKLGGMGLPGSTKPPASMPPGAV